MKKRMISFAVSIVMIMSLCIPSFAAEVPNNSCDSAVAGQRELTMRIVTQEEMDNIISNIQTGTIPLNTFDDIVLVSGKRVTESDGTEYFSLTLVNSGFVFDRVDIDGNIVLYDMSLRVVANKAINEDKLVYGYSRKIDIYPLGGHYATGTYTLRISDGDAGTTYTGTVAQLGG